MPAQAWEEQVAAGLAACRAHDLCARPDGLLLEDIESLVELRDAIDGLLAERIEAAHRREATVNDYGQTTRTWLQQHCQLTPHEASQRVFVSRTLSEAPVLADALHRGRINHDSARIVAGVLRDLAVEHRAPAEQILVELAYLSPPAAVATAGREILARTLSGEAREEAEQRRLATRHLSIASTFGGMVSVSGLLDPEAGEALALAVDALGRRLGPDDERSPAQRRADALGELARHNLACTGLPDSGGERPQIVVTLTYDQLVDGLGEVTLDRTALPISAAAARRLACDAGVIPAVLGGDGAILDLGRTTRTWPTAIRRAARLRDRGCAWPGCDEPLSRCDLHHIEFWALGGATSLWNSAHLCPFHHWLVHERSWSLRRVSPTEIAVARLDGSTALARAG